MRRSRRRWRGTATTAGGGNRSSSAPDRMSVRTVGVVVVNYNGGDLTVDCLRSVVRSAWPAGQLRVVLVDNASGDGVAARVRSQLPVVQVVERDTNDGFGAACNVGIAHLADVDAVALVNNDASVEP